MDTLQAIHDRRSIRHFASQPVPRELVERVLEATVQSPSAKNVQPWRFVVLEGQEKERLVRLMTAKGEALAAAGEGTGSLLGTCRAMAQAPVAVVILNQAPPAEVPPEFHEDWHFVMLQSTGGAIQTMLLAAHALGLGSLWICDILFAHDEVMVWLGCEGEVLVAAVSLGYADEAPGQRPRKGWAEVTQWLGAPSSQRSPSEA